MRKEIVQIRIGGALALIILLLAHSLAAPTASVTGHINMPQVGVTLAIDQASYVVSSSGKPTVIHATLTLFNRSVVPMTIHEHGQQYNWQILGDQGQTVWNYAQGHLFPHYIRLRTLRQGQIDYAYDVPLQTQDGAPLTPGSYTLRGTVIATGASASLPFTIAATSPAPPN